jgi:alkaline phosphatase D
MRSSQFEEPGTAKIVPVSISRRDFLLTTAASAAALPLMVRAQTAASPPGRLFRHGVASGDPLTDRVMLWTRVTPADARRTTGAISVRWRIATDETLAQVVAGGTAQAAPARDFTVKVDAGTLQPGRTYYYAFDAAGEQSPVGRTKTLPPRGVERLRLASVSCSNYPAGYFNVYRAIANRSDLDVVLHLGDYIYEFANGVYGDGSGSGRVPIPAGEATRLADYRGRYATYRSDIDLQDAHRLHPFVVVWDDHEIADNASVTGAPLHTAKYGSWATRWTEAYQAYLEWMPIRESTLPGIRLYRSFNFGDIADVVMLDTRGLRDAQVPGSNFDALIDPRRSLLGAAQEAWMADQLRASQRAGTRWRVLGQQVLFAPLTIPGVSVQNTDVWDGYPAARRRVFDLIAKDKLTDIAILTGDVHSSWAMDVPDPGGRYDSRTGAGSVAIELVTPAISSPPMFASAELRERATLLKLAASHLKYLEGTKNGYLLLDVTRDRLQADWYFVDNVSERSPVASKGMSFVCERGSSRLTPA